MLFFNTYRENVHEFPAPFGVSFGGDTARIRHYSLLGPRSETPVRGLPNVRRYYATSKPESASAISPVERCMCTDRRQQEHLGQVYSPASNDRADYVTRLGSHGKPCERWGGTGARVQGARARVA